MCVLAIKEIQIKITMRYYFRSARMGILKRQAITNVDEDENWNPHMFQAKKCKMVQPFWKIVRQLCEKLDIKPTNQQFHSERCFTDACSMFQKICTRMFTVMCACRRFSPISLTP